MTDAADNPVLKWAISVIADAPPMQNVVAFLIVVMLAAPLVRAGWREFRNRDATKPAPAPAIELIQQTPWLIETLTRIQLEMEQVLHETQRVSNLAAAIEGLGNDLAKINAQVLTIDKMLRRRAKK